jgi:BolA protein
VRLDPLARSGRAPGSGERAGRSEARIRAALAPAHLEIESHRHRSHAGAADGRGHFRVRIVSPAFAGHSHLARHRMLYDALRFGARWSSCAAPRASFLQGIRNGPAWLCRMRMIGCSRRKHRLAVLSVPSVIL